MRSAGSVLNLIEIGSIRRHDFYLILGISYVCPNVGAPFRGSAPVALFNALSQRSLGAEVVLRPRKGLRNSRAVLVNFSLLDTERFKPW